MSTADILAYGLVAQSLAWPVALVTGLRLYRLQLRVAAPPKESHPVTGTPPDGGAK